jgi:hypothetical protein
VLTSALPQVLLEMKHLLLQFQATSQGRVQRILQFLNAQGFKLQFDLAEQELRDCLLQLSTILDMAQFAAQVGASAANFNQPTHDSAHRPRAAPALHVCQRPPATVKHCCGRRTAERRWMLEWRVTSVRPWIDTSK